jgi:hypothetical protein
MECANYLKAKNHLNSKTFTNKPVCIQREFEEEKHQNSCHLLFKCEV